MKINVFDSIRILYSENAEAGIELYNKHVKNKFLHEEYKNVYFLCLDDQFEQTPENLNLIKLKINFSLSKFIHHIQSQQYYHWHL